MAKVASPLPLLQPLQERFERDLRGYISSLGSKTKLRDACAYALAQSGKRVRPLIVTLVAQALNHFDVSKAALCVELFHTASLIADDLPCMDNDSFRRNQPALHAVFGETIALLASYALISAAYEQIFAATQVLKTKQNQPKQRVDPDGACSFALSLASRCAGIHGATGGQYLDLFTSPKTESQVREVIHKKTVTLFEVSFAFGWVFGGGDLAKKDLLREVASHFGMAFQLADDSCDLLEDQKKSFNAVSFLGPLQAKKVFTRELDLFCEKLKALCLDTREFSHLVDFLRGQFP